MEQDLQSYKSRKQNQSDIFTYNYGNGVCRISSATSSNVMQKMYNLQEIKGNFYLEIFLSVSFSNEENSEKTSVSGLFAGYKTVKEESISYFTVSADSRSLVRNTACVVYFAEVSNKFIKGEENKLAIEKRGGELFFYINDQLVYRNDYQIPKYNVLGLIVPANGSVAIRNYSLYLSDLNVLRKAPQLSGFVISLPETTLRYAK